jgi:hypothetical protein
MDAIGIRTRWRKQLGLHIVDYTPTEGFAERLAKRFGGVVAETLISSGIGWQLR